MAELDTAIHTSKTCVPVSCRQAFGLGFRRTEMEHEILREQFNAFLTLTHELREYMLYLQSFPTKCACLVAPNCPDHLKDEVLKAARCEWEVVQLLEGRPDSQKLLHTHCLHVKFQTYRELMVVMERENWTCSDLVASTAGAWFPAFSQSSNLESIFREMEAAVKKGGCPQDSLANLACVAVRALDRRICAGTDSVKTVSLSETDWAGKSVRGLKERMWSPAAAIPGSFAEPKPLPCIPVVNLGCFFLLRCQVQV